MKKLILLVLFMGATAYATNWTDKAGKFKQELQANLDLTKANDYEKKFAGYFIDCLIDSVLPTMNAQKCPDVGGAVNNSVEQCLKTNDTFQASIQNAISICYAISTAQMGTK